MEFIVLLYRALAEIYLSTVKVVSHVVTSEYIHPYINSALRLFEIIVIYYQILGLSIENVIFYFLNNCTVSYISH